MARKQRPSKTIYPYLRIAPTNSREWGIFLIRTTQDKLAEITNRIATGEREEMMDLALAIKGAPISIFQDTPENGQ